jgi:hypothetical protein
LLLIVSLSSNEEPFPVQALGQVDAVLAAAGFKKEVRSVVRPGKEFSVTYEGPSVEKSRIEKMLKPVTELNRIGFSVDIEESVRFP